MVTEGQVKCAGAGMAFVRDHQSYRADITTPTIFKDNLRGLVTEEDFKIPHSELAMHSGAAGKEIIALAVVGNRFAIAIYDDGKGGCQFIQGTAGEVLQKPLQDKVQQMFGPSERGGGG